jgi:hypothetical protein
MRNNPWFKLAGVSLAGMVISFVILWGIQQVNQYKYYNGYNTNGTMQMNGYSNGNMSNMNQTQMNNMQMQGMQQGQNSMNNGMGMQGNMNSQGSMSNMQGNTNMQSGSSMQGSSNMQGGMMMDKMMSGMMGGM